MSRVHSKFNISKITHVTPNIRVWKIFIKK